MANEELPKFEDTEELPSWEDTEHLSKEEMSGLEASILGGVEGITMGFSDELSGAFEAAGAAAGLEGVGQRFEDIGLSKEGPTLNREKLLEAYKRGKEQRNARKEQAYEESPGTFIGSEIGGAFLTPVPGVALSRMGMAGKGLAEILPSMKGAEKIAELGAKASKAKDAGKIKSYETLLKAKRAKQLGFAAREGTKAGAIGAAGVTEASPLDPAFYGDVALGGTIGGVVSPSMVKGSHVIADVATAIPGFKNIVDSFKFGAKGIAIDEDTANTEARKVSNEFMEGFSKAFKNLSVKKKELFDKIRESGGVNTEDELIAIRDKLLSQEPTVKGKKEVQELIDLIGDYLGQGKEVRKAQSKLENTIIKKGLADPTEVAERKIDKQIVKDAVRDEYLFSKEPFDVAPDDIDGVTGVGKTGVFSKMSREGNEEVITKTYAESAVQPNFTKIERQVDPTTGKQIISTKDVSTGEVKAIIAEPPSFYDATKLDPTEVEKLKNHLYRYRKLAGNEALPDDVRKIAKEGEELLKSKLEDQSIKIGGNLKDVNKKLSSMQSVKNALGFDLFGNEETKQKYMEKVANFVTGNGDQNPFSKQSFVMKQLEKVDPDLAKEIDAKVTEMRRLYELAKPDQTLRSTTILSLVGAVGDLADKAANSLGKAGYNLDGTRKAAKKAISETVQSAVDATRKTALGAKSLDMVQMSSDRLQKLIEKARVSEQNKKFVEVLEKAYGADSASRRNAILWGLSQQPAFRNFYESYVKEEE